MSRDVVKEINKISKIVLSITKEEFEELEEMCKEQAEYMNPLKCATTARQHALAQHNKNMIDLLKALQEQLLKGKDL